MAVCRGCLNYSCVKHLCQNGTMPMALSLPSNSSIYTADKVGRSVVVLDLCNFEAGELIICERTLKRRADVSEY